MSNNDLKEKSKFEIVLEMRNFEIDMLWRRSNYFLLLNTSVAAGAGAAAIEGGRIPFLFFCIIGLFVCLAWIKVGLGAKFWQAYWEQVVVELQEDVGFKEEGKHDFFGNADKTQHAKERVRKSIDADADDFPSIHSFCDETHLFFRLFAPSCGNSYKGSILNKPSVSRWMHRTACFFFLAWGIAAVGSFFFKF